jgi:predicted HNH restriction endonuclease
MGWKNTEAKRAYDKKYYQEHREEQIAYHKKWYEHAKVKRVLLIDQYKKTWREIIKELGMDTCSVCGYNKNFAAIDFHHEDGIEKTYTASNLFQCKPTIDKIEKLKQLKVLCANCHRELHHPVNRSI